MLLSCQTLSTHCLGFPAIDQSFPGTFTWGNFLCLFLTEGKKAAFKYFPASISAKAAPLTNPGHSVSPGYKFLSFFINNTY